MKDGLINLLWTLGVRAFRLSRAANISSRLEPVFIRLAGLVPATTGDVVASLPGGNKLWMPAGYRDTRTVITGLFQLDETKLLERLTRPGMGFLDVGAYVGYFTIMSATWVGAQGRVYSFEPDALAYEYLLRNIQANSCMNVTAINKAVSDEVKTAILVRDPNGPETFVTNSRVDGDSVAVETTTLDAFFESLDWPAIDVVKMNIEGSELPALKGIRNLSRRNPGLQLVMEFNPMAMDRSGISRGDMTRVLTELGFRRGQIVERDLAAIPPGDLLPDGNAVYNILLTK